MLDSSSQFLICSCFVSFGSYFCYDITHHFEVQLSERLGSPETLPFVLHDVDTIPNIFIPCLCGLSLYYYWKHRQRIILSLSITVTIGMIIQWFAYLYGISSMFIVGRFIFATMTECLIVATQAMLAVWFAEKQIAFALGFNLCLSRLGNVASLYVYRSCTDITSLLCIGTLMCCVSTVFCHQLTQLDQQLILWSREQRAREGPADEDVEYGPDPADFRAVAVDKEEEVGAGHCLSLFTGMPCILWLIFAVALCDYGKTTHTPSLTY